MNFDSYIVESYGAHEIAAMGKIAAIQSCSKPIMLEGRILMGTPVEYFSEPNKHCHVVIDGLVRDTLILDSMRYPVLGSYCVERGELYVGTRNDLFLRVVSPIRDQISLSLVNDEFEPYDFDNGKKLVSITFTIDFFRAI